MERDQTEEHQKFVGVSCCVYLFGFRFWVLMLESGCLAQADGKPEGLKKRYERTEQNRAYYEAWFRLFGGFGVGVG
jgi:hypothetical protein